MKLLKPAIWVGIIIICFSCHSHKEKYPYSIADFWGALQPHLMQQVNAGLIRLKQEDSYLQDSLPNEVLLKLTFSEIPIIRAVALKALLYKPSIDTFSIIINHLDDTAFVMWTNRDEPIYKAMVSDFMLSGVKKMSKNWADSLKRDILFHHNYLSFTHLIINSNLDTLPGFHSIVQEMAIRDGSFYDIESALYVLSKYRQPEDVNTIAAILSKPANNKKMGQLSFGLLGGYANGNYWGVLKQYYDST